MQKLDNFTKDFNDDHNREWLQHRHLQKYAFIQSLFTVYIWI